MNLSIIKKVNLIGVEAGEGLNTNKHSAASYLGNAGLFMGWKTKSSLDDDGNIKEVHSVAAGLDYLVESWTCLFRKY